MAKITKLKKIRNISLSAFMSLAMLAAFMPMTMGTANAASSAPAKVSGVKVSSVTSSSAKITWKKAKRAKKYTVYMKKGSSSYKQVASTSSKTYTVKSLSSKTKYSVKIRGVKGNKYGKYSSVNKFTTKAGSSAATQTAVVKNYDGSSVVLAVGNIVKLQPTKDSTPFTVKISDMTKYDDGSVDVSGTTSEGLDYYYLTKKNGTIKGYVASEPNFQNDATVMPYTSANGGDSLYMQALKSNVTIYWTIDGSEPMVGQADLTGTSEYCKCRNGFQGDYYMPEIQLRGTVKNSNGTVMAFKESNDCETTKIFRTKVYKDSKLISEDYSIK